MTYGRRVIATRVAIVAAALAVYELLCRSGVLDPFSWVPISSALARFWELVTDPEFLAHTAWPTARMIGLSIVIATVTGLIAGTLLWRFPLAYQTANPYLTLYYSIPAFAFYPVLLSLLGVGALSLVLLSSLLGFAAMTANVVIGLRATVPIHVKVGQVLQLNRWRMLYRIYLPSAVPQILVGIRLAIAYTVIGVVGGEFLAGTSGLGYYIQFSYDAYKLVDTYAGIILVVLLSLGLNAVLYAVSRWKYPMETVGS